MYTFPVAEIFTSVNGEGVLTGQLAVFVRFTGCNLSCSYCDTSWANLPDAEFYPMTENDILKAIKETGITNVTLTGGEPLIHEGIGGLLTLLSDEGSLHIEAETNGSIDLSPWQDIPRVSFTVDYKLPGSGMSTFMLSDNFVKIRPVDTVKFVVSDREDLLFSLSVIEKYKLTGRCHVYLSPVFGVMDPADIVNFMKEYRLNGVNLQLQLHKIIWDPDTEGV